MSPVLSLPQSQRSLCLLINPYDLLVKSSHPCETLDHLIQCEMLDSYNKSVSYYLYPRSSIVKTPFRLSNSVGIIDSGYRGEIMAVVDNIDSANNDMKACIRKYMTPMTRMFQICSPTLEPFLVEIVDTEEALGSTERGNGGFGSTGV